METRRERKPQKAINSSCPNPRKQSHSESKFLGRKTRLVQKEVRGKCLNQSRQNENISK